MRFLSKPEICILVISLIKKPEFRLDLSGIKWDQLFEIFISEKKSDAIVLDGPRKKPFEEFFSGYKESPEDYLSKTFEDVQGYEDIVMLKDIAFNSHCEHHMVPIEGKVHLAYIPVKKVVGISKLARVVDIFAKRLQTQETMTMQIIKTIDEALEPFGTAIMIDAKHQCMTTRGINKPNVSTITTKFSGLFAEDAELRNRFMQLVKE